MILIQYDNRAILGMIASALNPLIPEVQAHSDHIAFHTDLAELEAIPDRKALIVYMANGQQFQIDIKEVI